MTTTTSTPRRAGTMRVARSRGALSGLLLVLLGAWGALIPFIGPIFDYAYTPAGSWTWTAGRFWLEVLPGAAALLAGLLLMLTANRAVGVFAGWLGAAAGAWFVVGPVLGRLWSGPEGAAGTPVGSTNRQVWEQIGFFSGLGAAILLLSALALGRFLVRSVRDVRADERHHERRAAEREAAAAPRTQFEDNRAAQPADETRPVATTPAGSQQGGTTGGSTGTEATTGSTRVDALGDRGNR
jgi:hypothetical protein